MAATALLGAHAASMRGPFPAPLYKEIVNSADLAIPSLFAVSATALATTGPQTATARITSVPGMAGDDHKLVAEMDGMKAVVDIYSRTSSIAGWSVVALLRNLDSPVVFY